LNYTIIDAKEKVADDEQWISQHNPIQISGYVRGQQEEGVYEVAVNQKSALLVATDTRFETTVRFRLLVTELSEIPVTLSPEYGGFTQMWKVYREVPKVEVKRANERRDQMAEAQTKLIFQLGELQRMDKEIEEIPETVEALKDEVSRIGFFKVFYEGTDL
ncbi:hypothetical protein ACFL6E_05025, partial [Candidatus Neomarinimicrobiota bacterium]